MRIVSKFQDFYDRVQGSGSDQSRVFFRETSEQDYTDATLPGAWRRFLETVSMSAKCEDNGKEHIHLRGVAVMFCGQVFRGIRLRRFLTSQSDSARVRTVQFADGRVLSFEERTLYDADEALSYLSTCLGEDAVKWKRRGLRDFDEVSLKTWIEGQLGPVDDKAILHWAIDNRIASALLATGEGYNRVRLVLNPVLSDVELYRLFTPHEAYQELVMFWGGVLAPESRPMVKIEDKYRIVQHGFDGHSFRKAPSKRR